MTDDPSLPGGEQDGGWVASYAAPPGTPFPVPEPPCEPPEAPKRWWQRWPARIAAGAVTTVVAAGVVEAALPSPGDECAKGGIQRSLADSDVPYGYTAVRDRRGFAIAVPARFVQVDPDDPDLDGSGKAGPERAALYAQVRRIMENTGVLFRIDPVTGEYVLVTRISLDGLGCRVPDAAVSNIRAELGRSGFDGIRPHDTTLGGRRGLVLLADPSDDDASDVHAAVFLLAASDVVYFVSVTYSTPTRADVDRMVASFRIR